MKFLGSGGGSGFGSSGSSCSGVGLSMRHPRNIAPNIVVDSTSIPPVVSYEGGATILNGVIGACIASFLCIIYKIV